MKVVILAGGFGTRFNEETEARPKPMIEIGGYPMLWHIMNIYGQYNFNEFIVALGYKGTYIKNYFLNYHNNMNDINIDFPAEKISVANTHKLEWNIHLVDTGQHTMTGGRLLRLKDKLHKEVFMLTYGDGVSNVNINELLHFHNSHGKIATVTAVQPTGRFGGIKFCDDDNQVAEFSEKHQGGAGWINGGFFVFDPKIFDYLEDDDTVLELDPMERLVKNNQLVAYRHQGFWQCMDTKRDRDYLENLYKNGDTYWMKKHE